MLLYAQDAMLCLMHRQPKLMSPIRRAKKGCFRKKEKQAMLLRNPMPRNASQKTKGQDPPVRQQMRTVVMVDGKPQGFLSKTCVPPSIVFHNKWVQNNAPNYSRYSHVAWKPKGQADYSPRSKGHQRGVYSQRGSSPTRGGGFRGQSRRANTR
ncbi:hypothetical protein PIB30_095220, partial [Stylosanthes scabra]|nr:hypothetical protein [Stylosanthes scabra]